MLLGTLLPGTLYEACIDRASLFFSGHLFLIPREPFLLNFFTYPAPLVRLDIDARCQGEITDFALD